MNVAGMAVVFDRYNCFNDLSVEYNSKVITLAAMEPGASTLSCGAVDSDTWRTFQSVLHISVMCIGGCSWSLLHRISIDLCNEITSII